MKHLSERRTEDLAQDLFRFQGWPLGRPLRGQLVRQNEDKAFPSLAALSVGASKTGLGGDAYPDFLICNEDATRPLIVVETKASRSDLQAAIDEACFIYGDACLDAGHPVLAVGIAGQEEDEYGIGVRTYVDGDWVDVEHAGKAITWGPDPESTTARFGQEISRQRACVQGGELEVSDYRSLLSERRLNNAQSQETPGTLGAHFEIVYRQKELHSREGIADGETLVVSPRESYNGTYGWLAFPTVLRPPFVTVAQTGSIGEAFVQLEPCAVNDDCLILLPRNPDGVSTGFLLLAASAIRFNRWRFSYGRKLTPRRIEHFRCSPAAALLRWADSEWSQWEQIAEACVARYGAPALDVSAVPEVDV